MIPIEGHKPAFFLLKKIFSPPDSVFLEHEENTHANVSQMDHSSWVIWNEICTGVLRNDINSPRRHWAVTPWHIPMAQREAFICCTFYGRNTSIDLLVERLAKVNPPNMFALRKGLRISREKHLSELVTYYADHACSESVSSTCRSIGPVIATIKLMPGYCFSVARSERLKTSAASPWSEVTPTWPQTSGRVLPTSLPWWFSFLST